MMRVSRFSLLLALVVSGTMLIQACSSPTSSNGPSNSGRLVTSSNGSSSSAVIDMGSLSVGASGDTSIRISNTGSASLVITRTQASSSELSVTVGSDSIAEGGYTDVAIHVVPADTGVRNLTDTLFYTTNGSTYTATINVRVVGIRLVPNEGSVFTYDVTDADSNGNVTSTTQHTITILQTDATYGGKTNVVVAQSDDGTKQYLHREDNGDVSIFVGIDLANISRWYTLPFVSRQSKTEDIWDTSGVTLPNVPIPVDVQLTATTSASDPTTISTAGSSFSAEVAQIEFDFTIKGLGGLIKVTQKQIAKIWYSPELTFFVKRQDISQAIGSEKQSTTTWLLRSYTR